MWNLLNWLIKPKDKKDYPDANPKGFKTTFGKVSMTLEEKNEHFKQLFEGSKRNSFLTHSDYRK